MLRTKPAWNKGIKLTLEEKNKLNLSGLELGRGWNRGKKLPYVPHPKKLGQPAWNKGKHSTEETKKKISLSSLGKTPWNKNKKGLQTAWNKGKKFVYIARPLMRGRTVSEEIKNKMRLAALGKPKSEKARINSGLAKRGEKSSLWRGGITPINKIIRNRIESILWRKKVFERDNYTCAFCGIGGRCGKSVYLQADHIKPFSLYPELRFNLENGRTLCLACHRKTDTYGAKMFYSVFKKWKGGESQNVQICNK